MKPEQIHLAKISGSFAVCKLESPADAPIYASYCFLSKTDTELSLLCLESDLPAHITTVEKGWFGLRVQGILDFSLIGVLADLTAVLAKNSISVFVVSTFDTDYLFCKEQSLESAMQCLMEAGYPVHR